MSSFTQARDGLLRDSLFQIDLHPLRMPCPRGVHGFLEVHLEVDEIDQELNVP